MADGVEVDLSELNMLAADLSGAGTRVRPLVRKALQVTAHKIRDDWRANAGVDAPQGFVKSYPSSITYDTRELAGSVEAEIGPEVGRAGGTAGFLEEGTVLRPPQHAGRNALEANEDDFVKGLEIAAMDALED